MTVIAPAIPTGANSQRDSLIRSCPLPAVSRARRSEEEHGHFGSGTSCNVMDTFVGCCQSAESRGASHGSWPVRRFCQGRRSRTSRSCPVQRSILARRRSSSRACPVSVRSRSTGTPRSGARFKSLRFREANSTARTRSWAIMCSGTSHPFCLLSHAQSVAVRAALPS
jgi:hypothetical protein